MARLSVDNIAELPRVFVASGLSMSTMINNEAHTFKKSHIIRWPAVISKQNIIIPHQCSQIVCNLTAKSLCTKYIGLNCSILHAITYVVSLTPWYVPAVRIDSQKYAMHVDAHIHIASKIQHTQRTNTFKAHVCSEMWQSHSLSLSLHITWAHSLWHTIRDIHISYTSHVKPATDNRCHSSPCVCFSYKQIFLQLELS